MPLRVDARGCRTVRTPLCTPLYSINATIVGINFVVMLLLLLFDFEGC